MFKASIDFRRITYDYYGDSSRIINIMLEAPTRKKINKLISKVSRDNIYINYDSSNNIIGKGILMKINIIEL